jgi:hypothetical protein
VDSPGFKAVAHQQGLPFGDADWAGRGYGDAAEQQRVLELRERADRVLSESMCLRWYARPDDLIGGWCVMPVDEPPSAGMPAVADFIMQEAAEHIARLHNQWLDGAPGG